MLDDKTFTFKKLNIILSCILSLVIKPTLANVESHFATIKSDPNALYAFFKNMPKGGELHYHLAGSAYPESMLALAMQGNFCLNPNTQTISKKTDQCTGINADILDKKPDLYHQTIRAWSMKDFMPGPESGHDHFFESFYKFMPIVSNYSPQLLAEVMKRASEQHELYLEIMVLPDQDRSATFGQLISHTQQFSKKQHILLANKNFQNNITQTTHEISRSLQQARHELGCQLNQKPPVCNLSVKFQYYVLREQPLDNVFAQALNGFVAASRSNELVGVNLVQPEDGIISLRDYREQMQIFKFLHNAYPNVHIALHAGELAPSAVTPENLRFHIHDAIFTGQAQRIGHGVSIAYEDDAEKLLNHMAKSKIPVEINLTSNRYILSITGAEHPLNYYLAHKVPVVLSTDDEGILRTDLTRQYVEAVIDHGLDYPTIKAINRNALTYSFLPGKSLWADPNQATLVNECQPLDSTTCQHYADANEKAKLQLQLEKQLTAFEMDFK